MDFQELGWRGMDWINLAQYRDRCQALVTRDIEVSGSVKWWEFLY